MVPTNAVSLRWEDLKTSTSGGEFTHFLGLEQTFTIYMS